MYRCLPPLSRGLPVGRHRCFCCTGDKRTTCLSLLLVELTYPHQVMCNASHAATGEKWEAILIPRPESEVIRVPNMGHAWLTRFCGPPLVPHEPTHLQTKTALRNRKTPGQRPGQRISPAVAGGGGDIVTVVGHMFTYVSMALSTYFRLHL